MHIQSDKCAEQNAVARPQPPDWAESPAKPCRVRHAKLHSGPCREFPGQALRDFQTNTDGYSWRRITACSYPRVRLNMVGREECNVKF